VPDFFELDELEGRGLRPRVLAGELEPLAALRELDLEFEDFALAGDFPLAADLPFEDFPLAADLPFADFPLAADLPFADDDLLAVVAAFLVVAMPSPSSIAIRQR